jgi:integrase/recombinase XerD
MTVTAINANTPLGPAIKAWKLFLNDQGKSQYTIRAFMSDMNLLATYLPPDRTLGAITTSDLNNYLNWMQNERGVPCSPKTLSRRITTLKSFFRWLREKDVIFVDPAEKVVQKTVRSPLPDVVSPDAMDKALDTADRYRAADPPDARPFALFKLLLDTGIKKGELLSLTAKHLDFDAPDGPIVFVRYSNPSNRYKERKIPLTREWIAAYDEYIQQYDTDEKLFPWSPRRLEYILEDLSKDADVPRISFDMCRWTAALMDFQSGMEPKYVRQKLGVSEIQWREVKLKLKKLAGDEADDQPDEDHN